MIYGVEGAIFPYALAQLSASCNERRHNRRAASTCRLRVSGRVCVYLLVIPRLPFIRGLWPITS